MKFLSLIVLVYTLYVRYRGAELAVLYFINFLIFLPENDISNKPRITILSNLQTSIFSQMVVKD